jgi:hypothetical protein
MDNAQNIERAVYMTAKEAEIIEKALMQYVKRCNQNAKNSLSGYGKATSAERSKEWERKAQQADEINTSIMYQIGGL